MLSTLPMIPPTSNIVDKSADVVGPYRLPPIPRQKEILNKKKTSIGYEFMQSGT